jgi:Spy/CpxP family protein refolding chaperone
MKKRAIILALAALVLAALMALPALAQDRGNRRGQQGEPPPGSPDDPMSMGPGMMRRCLGPCGMDPGPFWRDQVIAQQLGLTDEQIKKLEDLEVAFAREMISLESEMKLAHFDLQQVMMQNPPDEAAAKKAIEGVLAAQRKVMQAHVAHRIAMMKVLTSEQVKKLNGMDLSHRRRGRWPMRDFTPPVGQGPHH